MRLRFPQSAQINSGVMAGLEAWLSYGIAEFAICSVGQLLFSSSVRMTSDASLGGSDAMGLSQWRGTVELLLAYALCGAVSGILASFVLPAFDPTERRSRKLLNLTVILVYAVHVLHPLDAPAIAAFAAAWFVATAAFFDWGAADDQCGVGGRPLLTSAALIFSSGVAYDLDLPLAFRIVASMAIAFVIIGIATIVRLVLNSLARELAWMRIGKQVMTVSVILALVFVQYLLPERAVSHDLPVSTATAPTGRPNVVLVTMDTVRADHMQLYGYQRSNTPNLVSLGKGATVYSNFISAASITLTSHASIFTGLYPQSHGSYRVNPAFQKGRPLPSGIPTMATILDQAGYHTMEVAANRYYLRPEWGLSRGFQHVEMGYPVVLVSAVRPFLLRNTLRHRLLTFAGVAQDLDSYTWSGEEVNEHAFHLLDEAAQKKTPFFLFVNYMDAHVPYAIPASFSSMYPGRDGRIAGPDYWIYERQVDDEGFALDPHYREHLISQYDGAIASLDYNIGELIAKLKAKGLYDNTLIIITSDHGEALGEHGFISHDVTASQSQVHIPLMVKYPHETGPASVGDLASHVDLLPTVLQVAGVDAPADLQGISLLRLAGSQNRAIVAECRCDVDGKSKFRRTQFAIFSGGRKLIYSAKGKPQLYDLQSDPDENHNVFDSSDKMPAELLGRLDEWNRVTRPHYTADQFPTGKAAKSLQSLGYAR